MSTIWSTCYSYLDEEVGFRFSLTYAAILAAPRWLDDAPFPPLSPRRAIANAKDVVQAMLAPHLGDFEPDFSACALKYGDSESGALWYYDVEWYVPAMDPAADRSTFSVPVLFDGSTPSPLQFAWADRFAVYRRTD